MERFLVRLFRWINPAVTGETVNKGPESWVREEIRSLSAYAVPKSDGLIKLDAMENPYLLPDELREEWAALLSQTDFNRYPDPGANALREKLWEQLSLDDDQDIIFGNGSDELIQVIAMALAEPGRALLSVDPGFVMYRMIATFCGLEYVGVPLAATDFSLVPDDLYAAIEEKDPAVVFLAYPNNPTGNLFDRDVLIEVIEQTNGLVVIDEAYAPFTDASFLPLLGKYENLVVMRTVSKMGLAGLRLGYLVGPKAWLHEFDKVRLPYNINVLTQATAEFAFRHQAVFDEQTRWIRDARSELYSALEALPDVQPYPSEANFILTHMPQDSGSQLFEMLKSRGVLVKNLDNAHPSLKDCLRFTVGRPDENSALLFALKLSLSKI